MTDEEEPNGFEGFAVLELMGHKRLGGRISQESLFGVSFVRIDVPQLNGPYITQFYSPSAVYCITPTTEEIAKAVAHRNAPEPIRQWELPQVEVEDDF